MEEQSRSSDSPPGSVERPPSLEPGRKPRYTPEHKRSVLKSLSEWKGSRLEFCRVNKVNNGTLGSWEKAEGTKKVSSSRRYNPDQKRQAVEAFTKSGKSYEIFGKLFGVHPGVLGRWVRAYHKQGPKVFEGKAGRKPGKKPLAEALKGGIVSVKERFPAFGLRKVQGFLARFHGLKASHAQIRRVVHEEGLPKGKLPGKRWKKPLIRRFERSKPGEMWQSDITSFILPRHSQRVYLVAFMDDYSRFIVSWKLGLRQTQDFVQEALLEGIQRFGKPQELLTDQGRQYFAWRGKSDFQKLLIKQGIKHVVSRAHHPETLGKCERFWETVGTEFWSRANPQELGDAQERLKNFIDHYNHFRPHQGIGNAVPADRLFGVESEVRKTIEATMEHNKLAMALDEPIRQPVFLVGQIGDQAVSMHGERGKLVFHTPGGLVQEFFSHNLGIPTIQEPSHDRKLDESGKSGDHTDSDQKDGSQARDEEVRVQDDHPALSGESHLGDGQPGAAEDSPSDGGLDAGTLAGEDQPQATGREDQTAAPSDLADEPAGSVGDGGGSDGPTQEAAERNAHADGQDRAGGCEGPAETGEGLRAGQPGASGPGEHPEGHAATDLGDHAEGEKKGEPAGQPTGSFPSEPIWQTQPDAGVILDEQQGS